MLRRIRAICHLSSVIEIASRRGKDLAEHVRGQHARVGVVRRAVIAVEQREPVGRVLCAVAERQGGKGAAERRHGTVVGDASQENERGQVGHFRDRCLEEIAALLDLFAGRLVLRRDAAHRVGEGRREGGRAVTRERGSFARRKAEAREGGVQQIARIVAGERATGAVRALQTRCKTDDQQTRRHRPERWYRGVVPSRLLLPQGLSNRNKPRATRAIPADLIVDQVLGRDAGDRHGRGLQSSSNSSSPAPTGARGALGPRWRNCGVCWRGSLGSRGGRSTRSPGSRPIFACNSAISRKMSACRRSSSATIGGWVDTVDATVTRTPLRCTASTSERKSPSPENSTMWVRV